MKLNIFRLCEEELLMVFLNCKFLYNNPYDDGL